jgi:hypothetical protein
LDRYDLLARIAPAGLVLLPVVLLLVAGAVSLNPALALPGLLILALAMFTKETVRQRGKNLEPGLHAQWGGAFPTVVQLRHRGPLEQRARDDLHQRLTAALNEPVPTQEDEQQDPTDADRRYDLIARAWLEKARDGPTITSENISYGFRRNTLAIRTWGRGVALCTALAAAALTGLGLANVIERPGWFSLSAVASLILAAIWHYKITPYWVRFAADRFADALFRSIPPAGTAPGSDET